MQDYLDFFKYTNIRAGDMWEQILDHVNFDGKTVVDMGCGSGDFVFLANLSGATKSTGIDNNDFSIKKCRETLSENPLFLPHQDKIFFIYGDIESKNDAYPHYDIGICFSVLPYLRDPGKLLSLMRARCATSLIECQYAGDGPGFSYIENDNDMERWLQGVGWKNVKKIGQTVVKEGRYKRSIWMCDDNE